MKMPDLTTRRILIRLVPVLLVIVALWIFFGLSIYQNRIVGSGRYLVGRDRIAVGFQVSTFFLSFLVSCAGLLTLMAALAPRWLSRMGLGPNLKIDWKPDDWAYIQRWDRLLFTPANPEGAPAPAILFRMCVQNEGVMAAEAVQVMVETIVEDETSKTIAKYSPLRWADSYGIEDFERLKRHRCDTAVEPLIHAGATQYIDFGFIFAPGSSFYSAAVLNAERSGAAFWCFHPFYQWIGADEYAVLDSGKTYSLTLALSAKNSHLKKFKVKVRCNGAAMKPGIKYSEVVGVWGSGSPVQIQSEDPMPPEPRENPLPPEVFWSGKTIDEMR